MTPQNCRQAAEIVAPGPSGDWQADDSLGLTVTGAAMAATYDLAASEQDASDGTLTSLTLRGTAETSLTGGEGRGNVGLQFLANFPVSTDSVTVTGTVRVEAHGTALSHSQALVQIRIGCGPDAPTTELLDATAGSFTNEPNRDDDASASAPISLDVAVVERPAGGSLGTTFCTLAVDVAADSWARQTLPPTDLATAKATLDLQIAAGPPDCALSGVVRDGNQVADGHANPLVGVLVDLIQDGDPVTDATATDGDGRYCLRAAAASADAGEFAVRARLLDGLYDPPLFHTEHSSAPSAVGVEVPITPWPRPLGRSHTCQGHNRRRTVET